LLQMMLFNGQSGFAATVAGPCKLNTKVLEEICFFEDAANLGRGSVVHGWQCKSAEGRRGARWDELQSYDFCLRFSRAQPSFIT